MTQDSKKVKVIDECKDDSISILKAACLRSKSKKIVHRDDHFTIEDVDSFIAKRESDAEKATLSSAENSSIVQKNAVLEVAHSEQKEKRVLKAASLSDILGFNPKATKKPKITYTLDDRDSVSEEFRENFCALIKLREDLKAAISSLSNIDQDDSRDIGDKTNDYLTKEITMGLVSNEKETLFEVEAAIDRIFDGTYGVCEITGDKILAKRLESVPYTRYSLEGQEQMEKIKQAKKTAQVNNTLLLSSEDDEHQTSYYSDSDDDL